MEDKVYVYVLDFHHVGKEWWELFGAGAGLQWRLDRYADTETVLTWARDRLREAGQRIIGIAPTMERGIRYEIFTEQMPVEASRDTRSTTAVEQDCLASGLGMG